MMLKAGVLCILLAVTSALICPDGGSCRDDSTCCQTPLDGYGCCPLPNAECCEDHLHCCYEGMTCSLEQSKCLNETHSLPWLEKVPAKLPKFPKTLKSFPMMAAVSENADYENICPDKTGCPIEFSCLRANSGKYKCCPLPQGLSCADGNHCCPSGYRCSRDGTSCTKHKGRLSAVICPDGESECPDETTCCLLLDGNWGCCPMAKAVCCEDKRHCCPEGTICDTVHSKCVSDTQDLPMWEKFPARRREAWEDQTAVGNVTSVTCPGGRSKCSDHSTCCQLTSGLYGCCPYPDAVCCSDHLHCCPGGTTCDLEQKTCKSSKRKTPPSEKPPSLPHDVECPDKQSKCPDETTCCQLNNGSYGCCPMPRAVCCEDHLHCCPEGTKCDLVHSTCVTATGNTSWVTKLPGVSTPQLDSTANAVPCNDSVACADGSTCCKTTQGEWACCPLPEAVCCEDHLHCCPHNTICNLTASTCDDPSGSVPWLEKVPAFSWTSSETANEQCNSTTSCPGNATCCKTATGDWGCCPLPKAVCCEDHVHCCPQGTICNLAASTCDSSTGSTPWLEKVSPVSQLPDKQTSAEQPGGTKNVTCDASHACPDGSTCCKSADEQWACCPLPQAVCCEDHLHCCPQGTTCNLAASTCDDSTGSTPWLEKMPALTESPTNEKCDEQTVCPAGTTCCRQNSGEWACCPLPNAVCCEDHEHCCPKGYKCDVSQQTCNKPGALSLPWVSKQPALMERQDEDDTTTILSDTKQCDAQTSCPRDTTCCYMDKLGKWGCCPLPNAVCCKDGNHCCPNGYKCDLSHTSCTKGNIVIPWYKKEEALAASTSPTDVQCDVQSSCSAGTTCCQLPTGKWGCCPLIKAVCCADHEHCCPLGYSCNMESGTCENKSCNMALGICKMKRTPLTRVSGTDLVPSPEPSTVPVSKSSPQSTPQSTPQFTPQSTPQSTPQYTPEPAPQPAPKGNELQCDGHYRCPDSETCCRTSATTWACCPSPKAVCCSDMKHCCPAGYTCDAVDGSCTRTGDFNWDFLFRDRKRAFIPV
ncbi:hypothetical protein MATL_G00013380 [Megalops atlanticus]|uniref:Granulins domain-containing protein n=1 Tax=Megalops atlanticus TaxID=7932 RepID=A0A9D3QLL5_MEGAT|nr:hypothetical protein MATL_G00013380 [Megalops atlanticus]